jgi:rhamnulose-1-phosphate aldolase/alcohol dehydrogenase
MSKASEYKHVNYLWDDEVANKLDPVARLVYRSNILGADQRITNTGGGNTSSKIVEKDPITGEEVEVLWVKGSGGDLRTSKRENFSSLYQNKLMSLQDVYAGMENTGPKTDAEDEMVAMYKQCTFNLNPRASSIDTPLHSFIPYKHVDHMHPNALISIAACKDQEALTKEIFGDEVIWTPWLRPGFELGLELQKICREHPNAKGVVMGQHGLINWANDDKECYELTLTLIEKAARYIEERDKGEKTFGGQKYATLSEETRLDNFAEILPWLRGKVSGEKRLIGTIQHDEKILRFVNSIDAARLSDLGTSCPDHFLRTKIKPLYVDWNPQSEDLCALKSKLEAGIVAYEADYASYYNACKHDNSPAIRQSSPSIVLIPGMGMIAWGKNKSESRVTAEFYNCAVEVMRGSEAVSEYISLPQQEAFDIEYWLLEEAKLQRMPAEKELDRQVIVVVGAGSGIGQAVCNRIIGEGAHVVAVDLKEEAAKATTDAIIAKFGEGIGVAGTGISNCGPALPVTANVLDRESVQNMFKQTILAYGGIDGVVVTAGIVFAQDAKGLIPDDKWDFTFDLNVRGSYFVASEARPIWEKQGLQGSLVLTTSVNAVVPKKGSVAYDISKSAINHMVREMAIELAPIVRVNGVAPASVVKGSALFPIDRVKKSLDKYNLSYDESESDDALTNRLAQFYADRTLTKVIMTPEDQAEAFFLFLSGRLSKTTGQIINVDGGLAEAFLR